MIFEICSLVSHSRRRKIIFRVNGRKVYTYVCSEVKYRDGKVCINNDTLSGTIIHILKHFKAFKINVLL